MSCELGDERWKVLTAAWRDGRGVFLGWLVEIKKYWKVPRIKEAWKIKVVSDYQAPSRAL